MKKLLLISSVLIIGSALQLQAQKIHQLILETQKTGTAIAPTMWGLFFEDINFAADGGLYAELVKNRSFEFAVPMMGWKEVKENATGKILINNRSEVGKANARFAEITVNAASGTYGLLNEGFRGMGIKAGEGYQFSFLANALEGKLSMELRLVNENKEVIAVSNLDNFKTGWQSYNLKLTAKSTSEKAQLQILFKGTGKIAVDMISLFPENTWKNRPNGLRKDLVQLLFDLKPGFLRFPGGCIVEGRDLESRYQWKSTVGAAVDRKLIINRWNTEFSHRSTPDYFQSYGLGFYEYFQLSEDLGASPLPIINCGMACQFNTAEVVAMPELDPYIQDALDLIEFANGATTTNWGKIRADMGHPAPFNLKYLGIGNEQWDEQYIERYQAFEAVLKKQHPEIKLVSSTGPFPDGKEFDYAWRELKKLSPALVDEHYYRDPNWFYNQAARYDNYDRKGPKVFAGEFASHTKEGDAPESRNNWLSALSEAAFMTGLERNADVVQMASYAPLLAHKEAWQWRPDLIWFDNLKAVATPNYYVQQLFSVNKGTRVVPLLAEGKALTGRDSLFASASIDESTQTYYLKLVNTSGKPQEIELTTAGKKLPAQISVTTLTSPNLSDFNAVNQADVIKPVTKTLKTSGKIIRLTLQASSVNMLTIKDK